MIDLLMIGHDGWLPDGSDPPPGLSAEVCAAYGQLYAKTRVVGPWMGYLAKQTGRYVGTRGFKGPPVDNRVEIAYFTFPELEGRGIAAAMAAQRIYLARQRLPDIVVTARTLPEYGASLAPRIVYGPPGPRRSVSTRNGSSRSPTSRRSIRARIEPPTRRGGEPGRPGRDPRESQEGSTREEDGRSTRVSTPRSS
jgi:hypothetical protein